MYPGPITVRPINQPADTVVTNELRDVDQIRYIAPADAGACAAGDFRATVDLTNVKPDGAARERARRVSGHRPAGRRSSTPAADDPGRARRVVPEAGAGHASSAARRREGIDVGETTYDPEQVTVSGAVLGRRPASSPPRSCGRARPQGFDVDREIEARAGRRERRDVDGRRRRARARSTSRSRCSRTRSRGRCR